MSTITKRFAVTTITSLIVIGATVPVAPGRPVPRGMMPPAAMNFRVANQSQAPLSGFTSNPAVGLTTSLPALQQALALQAANQRGLQGTNTMLSRDLQAALRADQALARKLMQTNPALARELNAILNTHRNRLLLPVNTPLALSAGYAGSMYSTSYPADNTLSGSADIMSAQSQMMNSNQQAEMSQESVRRSKLEQRRRAFDEWLYERANKPSMEDIREQEQQLVFRRSRNDPPLPEIQSAQALNSLLVELQKLEAKGTTLAPVALDEALLKNINVTSTQNGANFGLLRNNGQLNWPPVLRELAPAEETQALRKEIDSLLKESFEQAKTGKVPAGYVAQLFSDVQSFRDYLKRDTDELTPAQYIQARRYLDDLESSLKILERDDAANYILGKFAAKGATVPNLVRHMSSLGLTFAPAVAGDEAAYLALQRALAEASQRAQLQTTAER